MTVQGCILIRHKVILIPTEIFNELRLCFTDNSSSYMTVTRWVSQFKDGTENLQDFQRPGRPIPAVIPSNQ